MLPSWRGRGGSPHCPAALPGGRREAVSVLGDRGAVQDELGTTLELSFFVLRAAARVGSRPCIRVRTKQCQEQMWLI